ncbi:hypothetical protein ACET3Z_018024 [Daucus carota]
MSDGEEGTLMRHFKPASSVQEVPKVKAPSPDRLSSVQAFHGRAATYYATIVASPTLHPNTWRSQDIPYAIPLPLFSLQEESWLILLCLRRNC